MRALPTASAFLVAWAMSLTAALAQAPAPRAYRAPAEMPRGLAVSALASGSLGRGAGGAAAEGLPARYRTETRAPARTTRPAAMPRRDYFPGMRAGQGPNANVVSPGHLCVPGRRAFYYGGLPR